MVNKKLSSSLLITATLFIIGLIFFAGFFIGKVSNSSSPLSLFERIDTEKASFAPYIQAWQIINRDYINQPVDQKTLVQGSIRGMLDSLGDPYTGYLDPEEFAAQNAPLEGEYTGIGAWVDVSGDALVIISPMPDSPAEKAGILPGDKVIMIDGENMAGLDPSIVLEKILGPADTEINISIEREGDSRTLEFNIMRAVIPIPSVEFELLDDKIGYIHIYTFAVTSYDEFNSALSDLLAQGAESLIIDLRFNTGGLVDAAIDITSLFIEDKVVLVEEWGDGTKTEYNTSKDAVAIDLPLYILVNKGTASASEITAGALQDYDRAVLIGTTTFGKGLIQNWIPLNGDYGAVRVTIAKWLTPKERQIQDLGLEPDVLIEFTQEDFEAEIDPQLEKAIQLIKDNNDY